LPDIHFQYNGFLLALFLLSITAIMREENLWAAFWFAVLLQFKHIFLYVAPVFFVYLLMHYCLRRDERGRISGFHVQNFLRLGGIVASVFAVSLGPFVLWGQLSQLLARLFPFQRGLCHAYWAPNVWVFYNLADRLLIAGGRKMGAQIDASGPSTSSGLVEEIAHVVLPTIKSSYTFVLTILMMAVRNGLQV
jgi:alpha-1,3-glucosyltransferase